MLFFSGNLSVCAVLKFIKLNAFKGIHADAQLTKFSTLMWFCGVYPEILVCLNDCYPRKQNFNCSEAVSQKLSDTFETISG